MVTLISLTRDSICLTRDSICLTRDSIWLTRDSISYFIVKWNSTFPVNIACCFIRHISIIFRNLCSIKYTRKNNKFVTYNYEYLRLILYTMNFIIITIKSE
uniref:Uncharacterized protein n=1 Tax=Cacopsylla melanoneura TaxID=428564 RepID=A0A8D8PQC2_9HEMI